MDSTDKISRPHTIDCRGIPLNSGRMPLVMGVVNVTPDSFSDGGRYLEHDQAIEHALRLAEEGADILDIGGESTRPGSEAVSVNQELARILPVIEAVTAGVSIPVSVDTRNARVAEAALETGCHLVNDISACRDESMPEVLCKYNAPVVIMHMKGEPGTMQEKPSYENVTEEVTQFLRDRARHLQARGIPAEHIIIDPGIGFGKRFRDNLALISTIDALQTLGYPVLVGASRKRFLGELLGAGIEDRLIGNLAVAAKCFSSEVDIIRVHDVKATRQLFTVLDALDRPDDYSADW
jgi:dihydropteroate synthase